MTGPVFVDTNLLVYRFDTTEPDKQERAAQWLGHLWATRRGRISSQVQHELYATLTRKLTMPRGDARRVVEALQAWRPVPVNHDMVRRAWALEDAHSLSWWDALIVAAAEAAGADILLTEDLDPGASYGRVLVVDPFGQPPPGDGVHEKTGRSYG
jgi:predicted nucleic acid-binding protein